MGAAHSLNMIGSMIPAAWSVSSTFSTPSFRAKGTGQGRQNFGVVLGLRCNIA